ncbi:putative small nuclear ribonucleoprotein [Trypanosoma vivax]|uniref:Putative small nuclear ribonucleoprotein n=1 Tax=Trypanosoma vivax (strain Y486) TaxID=1055687 RepID=G0U6E6_TRYVY|nr:putative small nuclear ribonucleoprotein [Trypanosoma vivax]CCC51450.1 putative small nuclear ribonucleoprotein [Trypanosoma vivax Y486]
MTDVPVRAVCEATGFFVKVETVEGTVYLGRLDKVDVSCGDVELSEVRCQHRDSSLSVEGRVFIKGSCVRLLHLPSDMRNALFLDWKNPDVQKELRSSLKVRRGRVNNKGNTYGKRQKATQKKLKKLL